MKRAGAALGACGVLAALWACHGAKIGLAARQIDFNEDIRPVLADNCFRCHGPDAKNRKAGLRLDLPGPAYAALSRSPGRHAVVPGKPDESELIRRINSKDPQERMPKGKGPLSAAQIALLSRWIQSGAQYKPLWSLIAPEAPPVPTTPWDNRAVNPIDRFVMARLGKEGLSPAPAADRETLINRVYLTLTGLPPSLDEVDRFVADPDPSAYEKRVDGLLASSAYAERMAGEWLNVARWADSDGYLDDQHDRFLWPWRDWVIGAFKQNMPYDRFATWQLAGDLLPGATREQRLATAFLRLGQRNTENGALNEEYRIESVVDKTNTVGTAFLGLTVGCARCHDHKYDAISQKDFYSLSGFFNSLDEPGVYAPGYSGIQGGPTLPWPTPQQQQQLTQAEQTLQGSSSRYQAALAAARVEARSSVAALLQRARMSVAPRAIEARLKSSQNAAALSLQGTPRPGAPRVTVQWIQQSLHDSLAAYYSFDTTTPIPASAALQFARQPPPLLPPELMIQFDPARAGDFSDKTVAPPKLRPAQMIPQGAVFSAAGSPGVRPAVLLNAKLGPGVQGQALYLTDSNSAYLGRGVGHYERTQQFSVDFWFMPARAYQDSVPVFEHSMIKNADDPDSGNAGYELRIDRQHLVFYMSHSRPYNMLALSVDEPLPLGQWSHIDVTYDGSSRAAGVRIYVNGKPAATAVIRDRLTASALADAYPRQLNDFKGIMFGTRFREKAATDSALDEFRVFNRALLPLEVAYLHTGAAALIAGEPQLDEQLAALRALRNPHVVAARVELDAARAEQNRLASAVPQVLVMEDTPQPRPTYRLNRGVYDQRREQVPVQALTQIYPWNPKFESNRLGLARWLFDSGNPLTARVFVNRAWQMHFGTGLVRTAEDFGSQGALPSNAPLLDWLAVEFVRSGWDVKHLEKLIVMSGTYRQSSHASAASLQRDPENVLLARGPRFRMPGAVMRDNALAVAGLLVRSVGGQSVYPYQPEGVWNAQNDDYGYPGVDRVSPEQQHRRTLYTFIKRNAPNPALQLLDSANPDLSTPRLRTSNTPLQALLLLNDVQYQEVYRVMATQALKSSTASDQQLSCLFRLARRHSPTAEQLAILRGYYRQQLQFYQADSKLATERIRTGVTPVDSAVSPIELAALTDATTLVMASPEAYFIQ